MIGSPTAADPPAPGLTAFAPFIRHCVELGCGGGAYNRAAAGLDVGYVGCAVQCPGWAKRSRTRS